MSLEVTCPSGHRFALQKPPAADSVDCPHCGQTVSLGLTTESRAAPSVEINPRDAMPQRGQRLGRFVLVERVGEGGAGVVYRAYDPSLDRYVALKLPRAGLIDAPSEVEAFLREGLAAGKLRHPHIVPVHDAGRAGDFCYIASAFIEGQTLKAAISENGQFSPREAAHLVARLAEALHYAHGLGVIHRDIKPGNIVLDAKREPHVMDFGLAHRGAAETVATSDGALVGTPAYMSPEQTRGKRGAIDARSDQWALGVVLYELLTGQRPFGGSVAGLIAEIQTREPAAPRKLVPAIPRDLETICLKCLSKSPANRYASCQALADDLHRFLRGEPIQARPVSRLERTVRWCRRQPALASAIAAAAALLMGAATLGGYHLAFRSEASEKTKRLTADLGTKEQQAQAAKSQAAAEQQRADSETRGKHRQACVNSLTRALEICESGEIEHGLLLMVDALPQAAAAEADDLERVLRTNIAAWLPRLSTLQEVVQPPEILVTGTNLEGACLSDDDRRLLVAGGQRAYVWNLEQGSLQASGQHVGLNLAIGWGPDDTTLVSVDTIGPICSLDATTGAVRWKVQPSDRRLAAAFSHDRKMVAVCNMVGQLSVHSMLTGEQLAQPDFGPGGQSILYYLAFSPDDTLLAAGARTGIRLWDVKTWQPVDRKFPDSIGTIEVLFTQDGSGLLGFGAAAQLYDPRTGQKIGKLIHTPSPVTTPYKDCRIAVSGDGRSIAIRGSENQVRLFNLVTSEQRGQALGHQAAVQRLVFSPDSRHLLTSSTDGTARLWNSLTSEPLGQPLRHGEPVSAVGFSSDGRRCYSGSQSGTIRIWDCARPNAALREVRLNDQAEGSDQKAGFAGEELLVTVRSRSRAPLVQVWNAATGQLVRELSPPCQSPWPIVALSRDGRRLALGYHEQADLPFRVQVFDLPDGTPVGEPAILTGHDFHRMEFSSTGNQLLVHSYIHITQPGTGSLIEIGTSGIKVLEPAGNLAPLAFCPGRQTILCRRSNAQFGLFDRAGSQAVKQDGDWLSIPERPVSFQFSENGAVLVVLCSSGLVLSFDSVTGRRIGPAIQQPGGGSQIAVDGNGKFVVVIGQQGKMHIWDLETGYRIGPPLAAAATLDRRPSAGMAPFDSGPPTSAVVYSRDGNQLVSYHADRAVRRWLIPQPVADSPAALNETIVSRTGTKLAADGGLAVLPTTEWKRRRETLAGDNRGARDELLTQKPTAPDSAQLQFIRETIPALASTSADAALVRAERWQRADLDESWRQFGQRDGRTLDALRLLAGTLSLRGKLHTKNTSYATATQLFTLSHGCYVQAGDTRSAAGKLFDLGLVANSQRDFAAARRYFSESRSGFEQAGNPRNVAAAAHRLSQALADLAAERLGEQNYKEAEQLYRECLTIREEVRPELWTTFDTRSLLGVCLLGQKDYAGAEPYLLSGYEGLKQRAEKIPPANQACLTEALQRLVDLYSAWQKQAEADRWRKELELRAAPPTKSPP